MAAKPVPISDADSAPYWQAAREHRLIAKRCVACGNLAFPPPSCCAVCLSGELAWVELSGRGVVFSFTVMHLPLVAGFEPPYVVALIELDDQPGIRVTANILETAIDAVRIGMVVEVTFEERAAGVTLPQFRPATRRESPAP